MAKSGSGNEAEGALSAGLAVAEVSAAELVQHPDFSEAVRLYVRMTLDACRQDLAVTKLFGNTTQHVAFSLIATLSARAAQIEGAPPLTPCPSFPPPSLLASPPCPGHSTTIATHMHTQPLPPPPPPCC